jgi:hypothetical protein
VTDSPENSGNRGAADVALSADERGNGDNVIGIGGVPHAQKKTKGENGEKRHGIG